MNNTKEEIIRLIKKKKELSGIDSSIIGDVLSKVLRKMTSSPNSLSGKDIKLVIKNVRNELRQSAGRFQKVQSDRLSLLNEGDIQELLNTHSSTSERIGFYPEIKKVISNLGVISILDLGCGINPIALASKGAEYHASDINSEDLDIIGRFFRLNGIKGDTFVCDLRNIDSCELPKAELCIMFKVLDVIEKKGHKLAEKVIKKTGSKYLLISFSTKTLSGKPMNHPQRGWIERLLDRLGYHFTIIKSKNEIFYLASTV